jgi:hypothetical protein
MNKEKYEEALYCLEMISRELGEGEHGAIVALAEEYGITISGEEAVFTTGSILCTKVIEPYTENKHKEWTDKVSAPFATGWSRSDFEVLGEEGGQRRLKYTACKGAGEVGGEIAEDLTEGICELEDSDLTEEEWLELTKEPQYKRAEKQVLRELIAIDLAKGRGLDW